jgi:hypothetical protein
LSAEGISYAVAVAILAIVIGFLVFRMFRGERKESSEILQRMKREFYPQLEANLSEIQQKLEKMEAGEYSRLVMRSLSSTLNLEFRLRFEDRAHRLDQLVEELSNYEKELAQLASNPADEAQTAKVKLYNSQLRKVVNELIQNIQALSKLDNLPGKLPVIGH